jgi:hypothetical protein
MSQGAKKRAAEQSEQKTLDKSELSWILGRKEMKESQRLDSS